jgi:hypothetical protein
MFIDDMLETIPGIMGSPTNFACFGVLLIVLYLVVSEWFNVRPLANIRGPPRPSWTFGKLNPALTAGRAHLQP